MEHEDRVCDNAAQACNKLETALSLYQALENNASEQEKRLLLTALRNVNILLCDPVEENSRLQIVENVDAFGSHLGLIALNRLVHDVELIKRELENVKLRKVRGKREERKTKQLRNEDMELPDEDNKCFERITKKRRELLSEVERSLPVERNTKRVGFLPSRSTLIKPKPSGDATQEKSDPKQTSNDNETTQPLKDSLHARRKPIIPNKVSDTRCILHNTDSTIERSKITSRTRTKKNTVKVDSCSFDLCSECEAILKAKNVFWGLDGEGDCDTESKEQILKRFIENAAITQLNKTDRQNQLPIVFKDPKSSEIYMIHRKAAGHAGRGTWATPPYCPIAVTRLERSPERTPKRQGEPVKPEPIILSCMQRWLSKLLTKN